ncbi:MAG: alkaline phosphatase family protein [Chthoniobacteraceae bacterium]|nr:alkaline phosphatase family protein [Chthoniobacteraceae bacterium]
MKPLLLAVQAFLCFALTVFAAPPRAGHVFIVSFDQGAPAGIQKAAMPVFKAMAAEGAHTWHAYTIVPSLTLPSHTSMLTGVGIQKHQILWNDYQPAKGPVSVPTIFSLAKEHGLTTAMIVSKEKFKTLVLPGSVDAFVLPSTPEAPTVANARAVGDAFAAQVGKLKPNLCFIHFGDPDAAGHKYGVDSPEKMQALADCDAALKTMRDAVQAAGIGADSVFILTADHGGHDVPEMKDGRPTGKMVGAHGSPATEDVEIPWVAWGKGVRPHAEITAPVVIYDTAATALWLLGVDLPESFWGRPAVSAFESAAPVGK